MATKQTIKDYEKTKKLLASYIENGLKTVDIAKQFNVARATILRWIKRMNLPYPENKFGKIWTQKEINFLIKEYNNLTGEELSKKLNRTFWAVYYKIAELQLSVNRAWKPEEDLFLIENYQSKGVDYCCDFLKNRTKGSIQTRCHDLDICEPKRILTNDEYERLRKVTCLIGSREDFDNTGAIGEVYFKCNHCHATTSKTRKEILEILSSERDNMFCSQKCYGEYQSFKIPPKDELVRVINERCLLQEIGDYFNVSGSTIRKWIKKYQLKLLTNPGYSFPCEKIKQQLKDRSVPFREEVQVLKHLNKKYRADILFDEYKTIIEINGKEHYDTEGNLKAYFQERHNMLVQNGWQVFEIPIKEAMSPGFLDKTLKILMGKPTLDCLRSV